MAGRHLGNLGGAASDRLFYTCLIICDEPNQNWIWKLKLESKPFFIFKKLDQKLSSWFCLCVETKIEIFEKKKRLKPVIKTMFHFMLIINMPILDQF